MSRHWICGSQIFVLFMFSIHILVSERKITTQATTSESDDSAMGDIRRALNIKLNWFIGSDPCGSEWQGVLCDDSQTVITGINLNNMRLSGSLPVSIGNLTNLQYLDMSLNANLTGEIPPSIGNLVNLLRLNLQSCGFIGRIPTQIGQLSQLSFLALNGNFLTGSIPSTIGLLKSLDWCDLSNNALTEELPESLSSGIGFDNLTVLRHMHLNNNQLSGPIPKSLSTMPKLVHLLLDSNQFSGTIPAEIGDFVALRILRLDNNLLDGPVPSSIKQLKTLTELHLTNNPLNGLLPDLSSIPNLQMIRAGYDAAAAPAEIPSWILSTSKLKTLELKQRNLVGEIPSQLFALPNLEAVFLDSNRLDGTIDFTNATQTLEIVSLEQNNISSIGFLPSTFTVALAKNPVCNNNGSQAFCKVDTVMWKPPQNPCIVTCENLKILQPSTCSCSYPLVCTIQFITPAFSAITQQRIENVTQKLSTQFNMSESQIDVGSAGFTSDHRLVMSLLFFPPGNDVYLQSKLVTDIILKLSIQNVSFPDFGPLLLTSSNNPQTAPLTSAERTKFVFIITVSLCVGLSALVISICILFCVLRKRQKSKTVHEQYGFSSIVSEIAPNFKGCRWFTLAELKKASDGFNSANLIGVGGYGKVYKGKLQTGELVAIKRAESESLQGVAEFRTEIELFSRLHHKNLVNLIGFCTGDGEQMLVYEFMHNRTLRDHLLEHSEALDWNTRLSIALGCAKGLEYLHELADPPVIHRDVKSSNILLDENLVAKVADLGLSKLAPNSKDGKLYTITQVKGTLGYLDPEYYAYQQLSEKSDVYSFGVVLIEIITGKLPIDNGSFIVKEIKELHEKVGVSSLSSFVDSNLEGLSSTVIRKYFRLALRCVEDSGQDRPRMNEVVKRLEGIIKLHAQQQQQQQQEQEQQQEQVRNEDETSSQSLRLSSFNTEQRNSSFDNALSQPNYSRFEMWSDQAADDGGDSSFQAFRFPSHQEEDRREGRGQSTYR